MTLIENSKIIGNLFFIFKDDTVFIYVIRTGGFSGSDEIKMFFDFNESLDNGKNLEKLFFEENEKCEENDTDFLINYDDSPFFINFFSKGIFWYK